MGISAFFEIIRLLKKLEPPWISMDRVQT